MNTIIIEKTDQGEISYDIFSKLVDSRILFIYDYITDEVATDIVATLLYLDHEDDSQKISIYLNTDGGMIRSIFMIYDIMKMISSPIETFCIGSAMNESALILAAGTKGKRFATRSSIIKINQLNHKHSEFSDMINAEITLKQSQKDNKQLLEAFADCTGQTIKTIMKDTERDFYMSPQMAVKYGIIDAVIGEDSESKKARK